MASIKWRNEFERDGVEKRQNEFERDGVEKRRNEFEQDGVGKFLWVPGSLREMTLLWGVCFYGPQRMQTKKERDFLSSKGV